MALVPQCAGTADVALTAVALSVPRDAFDLRIFVDADSDVCLARRLRRDIVERGRDVSSVLAQYERFVKPSRALYVPIGKMPARACLTTVCWSQVHRPISP